MIITCPFGVSPIERNNYTVKTTDNHKTLFLIFIKFNKPMHLIHNI